MKQVAVSENELKLWQAGRRAWLELRRQRTWGLWMTIGEALVSGKRYAMQAASTNKPIGAVYARAFTHWLEETKLDEIAKADRAALLKCMEARAELERWRETLTVTDRLALNHPRTVWRKYHAETQPKQAKLGKRDKQSQRDDDATDELNDEVARRNAVLVKLRAARAHIALLEARLRAHAVAPPPLPAELADDFDEAAGDEYEDEDEDE